MKLKDMQMFNLKIKTFAQVLGNNSQIASELTLGIYRQMDFLLLYLRKKEFNDLFLLVFNLIQWSILIYFNLSLSFSLLI